ncbi:MAG: sigma-70 family RNA polymerase sigma factor [Clostridia bacterium]|nr:sigma-70 family RNA polymerase sigma factor [Clostridia bacterium]
MRQPDQYGRGSIMFEKAFVNSACEKAIKAIAAGDKNALTVIYDKMHRLIYSTAWAVLNNHADAEDALQNTLCEVLRCAPAYSGGSARAWILSIARNQALNMIRKRKNEALIDEEPKTALSSPETEFIYLEALSKLSENEREAVMLRVYCRCRHKESAEILGVSVAAAEKLYQRGIKKLRDYYKEDAPDEKI